PRDEARVEPGSPRRVQPSRIDPMRGYLWNWQRLRSRLVAGLAAPGLLALAADLRADAPVLLPPVEGHAVPALPAAGAIKALDLSACKALALEKQPAVHAARSSLAAALTRQRVLDNLRVPRCLQPDLPTRRLQARLGVAAAEAVVRQAE